MINTTPYEQLTACQDLLQRELTDLKLNLNPIKFAVVLGSGLGDALKELKVLRRFSYGDLPYFPTTSVQGHPGEMQLVETAAGIRGLLLRGRAHAYEGHSLDQTVFPIRLAKMMGATHLVLTNASGGLGKGDQLFAPGDLVLIEDHLNFTGLNPLVGPNLEFFGPRFPDMSQVYCPQWRHQVTTLGKTLNIKLDSGVYIGVLGPCYETPAEIRSFKILGANLVGMSTVLEAIAAKHAGMKILGISCVTNLAAGLSGQSLNHDEVKDTALHSLGKFDRLLTGMLNLMGNELS